MAGSTTHKSLAQPIVRPPDPVWMKFAFGGISCMAAACVTNPIDVIKTRLQLQGELQQEKMRSTAYRLYGADKQYKGMLRGVITIIREESLAGLYKGLIPSILREGSYSTLRVGGYDVVKDLLGGLDPAHTPLWKKIVAGATSGAFGACIANPTDLVKVRMQAQGRLKQGEQPRYTGTIDAFVKIYRHEGLRGLYRGVWPTTQRAALLTASQLSSYDHIKHTLLNLGVVKEGPQAHFACSMAAGFVAAVVTSPVDTIKTRVMNQKIAAGVPLTYTGTLDCFWKLVRTEGIMGLYKGHVFEAHRLMHSSTDSQQFYAQLFTHWTTYHCHNACIRASEEACWASASLKKSTVCGLLCCCCFALFLLPPCKT